MATVPVYQATQNGGLRDLISRARNLQRIAVKPDGQTSVQLLVKVSDLRIDPVYQRFAVAPAVHRIAGEFDPLLLGVVLISLRSDGEFYVIDGQHRVLALIERGEPNREIPALCYEGLTQAQEAWIFSESQRRRKGLTPLDIFRSDLIWGEDEAVAIHAIVERAGFTVRVDGDQSNMRGNIPGIAALRTVYRLINGPALLAATLDTAAAAWGTDTGPKGLMVQGIGAFLNLFDQNDELDRRRLARVIGMHSPDRLMADSRNDADVLSLGRPMGLAHHIHTLYQHKLTRNRLPEWDEASRRDRSRRSIAGRQTRKQRGGN